LVDWGLVAFIVVLAVLWALLWLRFRGSTGRVRVYPLLLIARTGIKGGPLGGALARLLSLYGWFSIVTLVIAMAFFYYLAVTIFIRRYIAPPPEPGFAEGFVPLLPGITIPLDELPLLLVPIGIAILLHELAHALVARAVGVRVKDAGFILLAFIPGAFVEPDEGELRGAPITSRLKVYSAGVAANVILAAVAFGLLILLAPVLNNGVIILDVEGGSPADLGGLKKGMVVVEVNGVNVRSLDEFLRILEELGVRDRDRTVTINLKVLHEGREESVTIVKPEGRERLGVRIEQNYIFRIPVTMLQILVIINLALALINAAPILIPTPAGAIASDGAHLVGDLITTLLGEKTRPLVTAIGLATLLLVVSLLTLTPIDLFP
jgi:membrane-associated protease RseP (regulator of RpoE activity)